MRSARFSWSGMVRSRPTSGPVSSKHSGPREPRRYGGYLTRMSAFPSEPAMTTSSETAEHEYDPFEDFNKSAGIGVIENPYELFALVRPNSPVLKEDVRAMVGLDDAADITGMDLPDVFTAFSFEAVQTVLRDGDTFSSAGYAEVMGQVMGHTILEM